MLPRRGEVVVGLYGVVLLVVFGKAYTLVPAYFDRELAWPRAIALQFPLSVGGTVLLGLDALGATRAVPEWAGVAGGTLWVLGVAVCVSTLSWTIRTNATGRETATSEAKAERRPLDRLANAFVPLALGYLALGSYETLAVKSGRIPSLLGASTVGGSHLLAAGTATLLVFAIGFRLLPRFLVATPPRRLPAVVLAAGAIAPTLLVWDFGGGTLFRLGAVLEAVAIVGFAVSYAVLYSRSGSRRVAFLGPLLGGASGVLGVGLGLFFAFGTVDPGLVSAHRRLNLLGFLGLTIVGVVFQFYPPAIGRFPGANDRSALAVILGLAGGIGLQTVGLGSGLPAVERAGAIATTLSALGYVYLLGSTFASR
jgi:hypothetical protein